ncbi:hypothetical protein MYU51_011927 [Penicillium brevicompactum]
MGTAMSLELDAGMEEALDRYEKDILFQISTLSITAKEEEEDPATDSDFEQSPKCICDFEWCYSCGKEWGSCECVLWEEYYLLDHE